MKIPRMSRVERRQLIRLGRRSGDPYTALRFQAVARLGLGQQHAASGRRAGHRHVDRRPCRRSVPRRRRRGTVRQAARQRRAQGRRAVRARVLVRLAGLHAGGLRMAATDLDPRAALLADAAGRLPPGSPSARWAAPCRASALGSARRSPSSSAPGHASDGACFGRDSQARSSRERRGAGALLRRGRHPSQPQDRSRLDAARPPAPHRHARQESEVLPRRRARRAHRSPAHDRRRRKNAALFCQLLWLLASRYRRARRIHLIVDNYGIHSALLTRKTARRARRPHRPALSAALLPRLPTASSASGRTSTPTSPATTAARP